MLEVRDLSVRFGGVVAVDQVSLAVPDRSIVGLIGPNGAGKTTLIEAICGFVPATGSVELDSQPLDGMRPHVRARAGVTRTFQSLELFEDLTIAENLLAAYERPRALTVFKEVLRPRMRVESLETVVWSLGVVGLAEQVDRLPGELSQGQRKLVAVARALVARPKVLLLDEPAAGLDSSESAELGRQLRTFRNHGIAVMLVDHDVSLIMACCDIVHVLDFGNLISTGTPSEVRADSRVITAYLGGGGGSSARSQTTPGDREGEDFWAEGSPGSNIRESSGSRWRTADLAAQPEEPAAPIVEAAALQAGYAGVPVIRDVHLSVNEGEVVALLGANGAGKTTTLLALSGVIRPLGGEVRFAGAKVNGVAPQVLARRGLTHLPEDRGLFQSLSVRDNLRLGERRRESTIDQVIEWFPTLGKLLDQRVGLLSGGEQQMLALGRALAHRPRVLLIDEASSGLAPILVERLFLILRDVVRENGTGVLLVEQFSALALEIAQRAYVMHRGQVALHCSASELLANQHLLESSYLGVSLEAEDAEADLPRL